MITEFKPRKAKWGFKMCFDASNILEKVDKPNCYLGPRDRARYELEMRSNGHGNIGSELIIYVHDDSTAAALRSACT